MSTLSFQGIDKTSFLLSTEYVWVGEDSSILIEWLYVLRKRKRQEFYTLMLTAVTPLERLQTLPQVVMVLICTEEPQKGC